jgi:hypothetical protein
MRTRKPLQGITNILRFNWHYYAYAGLLIVVVLILHQHFGFALLPIQAVIAVITATILCSLIISAYIYDFSDLYKLKWLRQMKPADGSSILNIHAGFDETSALLQDSFKDSKIIVADFYNPQTHTEISIKRARQAYPPYPGTIGVSTINLPMSSNSIGKIFLILSAHEIRKDHERVLFFKELIRLLTSEGEIVVIEHLRDTANFLAYNIGAFHFLTMTTWISTFQAAGLAVVKTNKITPFITVFILEKNAFTS